MKPLPARERRNLGYRDKQRLLESIGLPFSFTHKQKLTPQAKAAITRRWRDRAVYFTDKGGSEFKFIPLNKAERSKVIHNVSRDQLTKKGVLVQAPKGAKVSISKKTGRISISKGKISEELFRLSKRDFLNDPEGSIQKLYKQAKGKHKQVFITFRGFAGSVAYSPFQFLHYFENDLLPELSEKDPEEVRGRFGIKIVSIKPTK